MNLVQKEDSFPVRTDNDHFIRKKRRANDGFIKIDHLPVRDSSFLASSMIFRISVVPEFVAETSLKVASVLLANKRASVVFPHPLWPQKIILPKDPFVPWSKCTSKESGPRRWSCPTKSENSLGRRRSAGGVVTPVIMILVLCRLGGRSLERRDVGVFKSPATSWRESGLWEEDGSIVGRFLAWLNIGAIDNLQLFWRKKNFSMMTRLPLPVNLSPKRRNRHGDCSYSPNADLYPTPPQGHYR